MKAKKLFIALLTGSCACFIGAASLTACSENPMSENSKTESLGLEYTLNSEENSYSLTGIGTCKDTKIIIPEKYNGKNITAIEDNAFNGCTNVISVEIPDSVISIGEDAFYDTAYYNNENNWENGVLYIEEYLIRAKTSINGEYTIKDGTRHLASSAFYECNNLTGITIPESVNTIGSAIFWKCNKLENVVLSSNLVSIENWTFYTCNSLTSITIPDSVTSIGCSAFAYCKNLTSVKMGNGITSIESQAFYECNSLTSIIVPNSVETIGNEVFWNCYNLTRVDIGSGVRSIDSAAFYNCIKLKDIYITDMAAWCNILFRGGDVNPLASAENFYLNNELVTQLIIPETVTIINAYAFNSCKNITSVVLPSSVKFIDHDAFIHCDNLTSVYYEGTESDWAEIRIGIMNQSFLNATRYYYSETEPALKSDGTAYNGNYWHYGENAEIVEWIYVKAEE